MSKYIRTNKIDPNECPNKYLSPIYSNIQIFEYIRHTLIQTRYAPDNKTINWLGDISVVFQCKKE